MCKHYITFLGVNFYPGIRFLAIFVTFHKRVKHSEKFRFCALKFMKTYPVIRFMGTFAQALGFLNGEILPA